MSGSSASAGAAPKACATPKALATRVLNADRLLAEQLEAGDSVATQFRKANERGKSAVALPDGTVLVRRTKPANRRYYVVTNGPANLLGIWHARWADFATHLPGGKLFGSGCQLHGYDTLDRAKDKWFDSWESHPPEYEIEDQNK